MTAITGTPHHAARQWQVLAAIGTVVAALVLAPWQGVAAVACLPLVIAAFIYIVRPLFAGEFDKLVVFWATLFPLGYYYLSFPPERPVISFDRIIVGFLMLGVLVCRRQNSLTVPREMKKAAIAWALFVAASSVSMWLSKSAITVAKFTTDAFVGPALLGWYIVRQFRVREHARPLHLALCAASVYTVAIGLAEVVLQRDLMAFEYGQIPVAYDKTDPLAFMFVRSNGPYSANNSFALIGMISLFLLMFLWSLFREEAGRAGRAIHFAGCSAALLQALLPLFRSVMLTFVVIVVINLFYSTGVRRLLLISGLGALAFLVLGMSLVAPGLFADRSKSDNFYQRIAQNEQTLKIFLDHPIAGIGLGSYNDVAETTPEYQTTSVTNLEPVNYPHSNLGAVLAEEGIIGIVPYVAAQILLVAAFWRLRKGGAQAALAWKYFVFVFLAYWVSGLSLTAGYYSDLNMIYILAVSLLYRHGIKEFQTKSVGAFAA